MRTAIRLLSLTLLVHCGGSPGEPPVSWAATGDAGAPVAAEVAEPAPDAPTPVVEPPQPVPTATATTIAPVPTVPPMPTSAPDAGHPPDAAPEASEPPDAGPPPPKGGDWCLINSQQILCGQPDFFVVEPPSGGGGHVCNTSSPNCPSGWTCVMPGPNGATAQGVCP